MDVIFKQNEHVLVEMDKLNRLWLSRERYIEELEKKLKDTNDG